METATSFGADVQQTAKKMGAQLADSATRAREAVKSGLGEAPELLSSFNAQIGAFVRQQPIVALAGAFMLGYVVARTARAFQ